MSAEIKKEYNQLTLFQKTSYASGEIGTNIIPMIVVGWLLYFYTGRLDETGNPKLLISLGAFAIIGFVGRLVDSLADPLVGFLSDKYTTRWGRRKPWIIIGAPLLALFTAAIWFPPGDPGELSNVIWLTISISGLWFFYTVVVAPYLSLLPEITTSSKERVETSTYMGLSDVLAIIMATIVVAYFIGEFKEGVSIGPFSFTDGYKLSGVVFGIFCMVLFIFSVLFVKENPLSTRQQIPFSFIEASRFCLKNKPFVIYIAVSSLFRVAFDVLVAMIPFMVVLIMGFKEDVAGYLQGGIVLLAVPFFWLAGKLAEKLGKKKTYSIAIVMFTVMFFLLGTIKILPFFGLLASWIAELSGSPALENGTINLVHVIVIFAIGVFPLACSFVLQRPILADICDEEEKITGYRREGMLNGMEGFVTKLAAGIAGIVASLSLDWFGNTKDDPGGVIISMPLCGVMLLLAYFIFKKYPINK